MEQAIEEFKQIDDLAFDELRELNEFDTELFTLEYELDEEEKIVAKLHNICRATSMSIKHLHSLIRRIHKSSGDKTIPILKNMICRQVGKIEKEMDDLGPDLEALVNDEKAGEKIARYCKKVESIIRRKVTTMKEKYEDIENTQ